MGRDNVQNQLRGRFHFVYRCEPRPSQQCKTAGCCQWGWIDPNKVIMWSSSPWACNSNSPIVLTNPQKQRHSQGGLSISKGQLCELWSRLPPLPQTGANRSMEDWQHASVTNVAIIPNHGHYYLSYFVHFCSTTVSAALWCV